MLREGALVLRRELAPPQPTIGVPGARKRRNGFFCVCGAMRRILGHKMRIIGGSLLDEPMWPKYWRRGLFCAPLARCARGNCPYTFLHH